MSRPATSRMPKCKTILGLSNCSFGLSPHIRHVLNSVFLHYAIEAGLDMVIVHAGKIMPLYKIDEKGRQLATDLIFDNRKFEEVVAPGVVHHYEPHGTIVDEPSFHFPLQVPNPRVLLKANATHIVEAHT